MPKGVPTPDKTHEEQEKEANYFAMCLLMPEALFRKEVAKLGPFDLMDEKPIKKLAQIFEVPQPLIIVRMGQIFGPIL